MRNETIPSVLITKQETITIETKDFPAWLEEKIAKYRVRISQLEEKLNELYAEINDLFSLRTRTLSEEDRLGEFQRHYTQLEVEKSELVTLVDQLETTYLEYSYDQDPPAKLLTEYEQYRSNQQSHVSKRKAAILRERLAGTDPRNISDPLTSTETDAMHITAGPRHTHVSSNAGLAPEEAVGEFFSQTAGTHGGKSRKGWVERKARLRPTKGGKPIRKK